MHQVHSLLASSASRPRASLRACPRARLRAHLRAPARPCEPTPCRAPRLRAPAPAARPCRSPAPLRTPSAPCARACCAQRAQLPCPSVSIQYFCTAIQFLSLTQLPQSRYKNCIVTHCLFPASLPSLLQYKLTLKLATKLYCNTISSLASHLIL